MQPHILLVCLLIYLVDCRPQHYDEYSYWRTQPRSISSDNPFNQRYNYNQDAAAAYDPTRRHPVVYNNYNYDGYNQPRASLGLSPRIRGPAGGMIPEDNSRSYERNDYINDRVAVSPRIDSDVAEHKTHATRILNSPKQTPRPVPAHDIMLGDQPSDFVFPGAVHIPVTASVPTTPPPNLSVRFLPDINKIAQKCKNTFCESVDDYPTHYIDNVLKYNASNYRDLLGVDEIHTDVSIHTRIGTVDGSPMCRAKEEVVRPKVGQNKEGQWLFILNSDSSENIQGIRVEICEKENAACEMSSSFPVNYVTECKQKYIFRKMLALDPEGNPIPDNFRIPSCCSCYFKNDIHFAMKSKRDTSPAQRVIRK